MSRKILDSVTSMHSFVPRVSNTVLSLALMHGRVWLPTQAMCGWNVATDMKGRRYAYRAIGMGVHGNLLEFLCEYPSNRFLSDAEEASEDPQSVLSRLWCPGMPYDWMSYHATGSPFESGRCCPRYSPLCCHMCRQLIAHQALGKEVLRTSCCASILTLLLASI